MGDFSSSNIRHWVGRKNICIHFSGVSLACLNLCHIWVELCVYCVGCVVNSKLGDVLGTGAERKDILDNGQHTLTFSHTRSLTAQITETTQSLWPFQRQTKTWTRLFPLLKGWDDDYTVAIEMLQMTKYCQWSIHDKVLQQMFHDQRIVVVKLLIEVLTFFLVHLKS